MAEQQDDSAYKPPKPEAPSNGVVIVDVKIPFGSAVVLIIKFALAAIPAAILLAVIVAVFATFIGKGIGGL